MQFSLATRINDLEASATEVIENQVKLMRRKGVHDIVSLGVGEPCFETPANIVKAAQLALQSGKTKYQPTAGDFTLREEICRKLKEKNGIDVGVEDIMVTPGAKFAIFLTFQVLIEPGDRVIILCPAWGSHSAVAKMLGAEIVPICTSEADGYQPDLNAVREAMRLPVKCIVINSPCNPTGAVYDRDTLRAIVESARDRGALVLSDEIYEALVYEGEHFSPGAEYDNVITVNGFSKTYAMTGWRLGYVTAPREILKGMIKLSQHSVSCVTAFAQAGAIEALRSPESQLAVNQMIEHYRRKRRLMIDLLERSGVFQCRPGQGTFYLFPSYSLETKSLDLSQELLEKVHVATVPGVGFGECGEYHLRLSYSTADEDILEAFARMEDYFKRYG